jgi:hypothetical protein
MPEHSRRRRIAEPPISSRDLNMLLTVVKANERAAKGKAKHRKADMLAEFERQISAIYHWDQEDTWGQLTSEVRTEITKANKKLSDRCNELGIPKAFQPSIAWYWSGRGENASKERRAELRKLAQAQAEQAECRAVAEIEAASASIQARMVSQALTDSAAKALLAEMPTLEQLMPSLDIRQIEAQPAPRRDRWRDEY